MKEIKVGNNEQGQRFDKLLAKILREANKGFIYKMLRKKNITLNNKKASGNEILKENDIVKIFLSDETFEKFAGIDTSSIVTDSEFKLTTKGKENINKRNNNKRNNNKKNIDKEILDIVAETKDYIIINKPVGMLSQKANKEDISIVEYLIEYMLKSNQMSKEQLLTFKPGVCNRLDRNTSGLIIAGKSLIGLQKMTEYIKNRDVDKFYLALVKGKVSTKQHIDGYLVKDNKLNMVKVYKNNNDRIKEDIRKKDMYKDDIHKKENAQIKDMDKSHRIETEYEPIIYNDSYTLLKVKLITGKTHQIRAHLASVNHPLIGDYKYGDTRINDKFKNKYKLTSQLLHAYELRFHNTDEDVLGVSGKVYKVSPDKVFMSIINDIYGQGNILLN